MRRRRRERKRQNIRTVPYRTVRGY